MFIHLLDLTLQADVAGATHLTIHLLAALLEMDGDVAGAAQGDVRIIDVSVPHLHITGADEGDIRRDGLQTLDPDIAGTNQFRLTVIADDLIEGDVAGASEGDLHLVGIQITHADKVAGAAQADAGQVGRTDMHGHITHIAKGHVEYADLPLVANDESAILDVGNYLLHRLFRAFHADVVSIGLEIIDRGGSHNGDLVESLQGTGLYHFWAVIPRATSIDTRHDGLGHQQQQEAAHYVLCCFHRCFCFFVSFLGV